MGQIKTTDAHNYKRPFLIHQCILSDLVVCFYTGDNSTCNINTYKTLLYASCVKCFIRGPVKDISLIEENLSKDFE